MKIPTKKEPDQQEKKECLDAVSEERLRYDEDRRLQREAQLSDPRTRLCVESPAARPFEIERSKLLHLCIVINLREVEKHLHARGIPPSMEGPAATGAGPSAMFQSSRALLTPNSPSRWLSDDE